jgi:membrane-associated phospholipid phosphatase
MHGWQQDVSARPRHSLALRRSRLVVTASVCLAMTALLALAVAHSRAPASWEQPVVGRLGNPSAHGFWTGLAEFLAAPAISAALIGTFILGSVRRAFLRVVAYASVATVALLVNENVMKPLVHRTYDDAFTFPSGHVTAVSATALAVWLAMYPLLTPRVRTIAFLVGVGWALLVSLAVIGAQWHTPLDAVGAILLSVGIVTAGAAVIESVALRGRSTRATRARMAEPGAESGPASREPVGAVVPGSGGPSDR